jgi:RNA-directed DNA polymerase
MNEFDQFIKHVLKIKYYARYTDDFVIISESKEYLEGLMPKISLYLKENLRLDLHPDKILIRKYSQGVDFLGYIVFPKYRLVRKRTVKRMYHKLRGKVKDYRNGLISELSLKQTLKSYEGVLSHANAHEISEDMKNQVWF